MCKGFLQVYDELGPFIASLPYRVSLVGGIFRGEKSACFMEVGVMELAFTEVFKFLEIFAEQNMHIQNSNNALNFIIEYSIT